MRNFCGIRFIFLISVLALLFRCSSPRDNEVKALESYISSLKIEDIKSVQKLILFSPVGCGKCVKAYIDYSQKNNLLNNNLRFIITTDLQSYYIKPFIEPLVVRDISMKSINYDFPLENISMIWLEGGKVKKFKNYIDIDLEKFEEDLKS